MNAMKNLENSNERGNSGKAVHHNQQIPGLILKVSIRLHNTSRLMKIYFSLLLVLGNLLIEVNLKEINYTSHTLILNE